MTDLTPERMIEVIQERWPSARVSETRHSEIKGVKVQYDRLGLADVWATEFTDQAGRQALQLGYKITRIKNEAELVRLMELEEGR